MPAIGCWWGWFALWLLPRATWFQLVTRLRNIAEHALVAKDEPDPLRHARTTRANWLERALIAPYWVNYHCEHHMFMHVPCWRLPGRAARLWRPRASTERMRGAPGYLCGTARGDGGLGEPRILSRLPSRGAEMRGGDRTAEAVLATARTSREP